MAQNDVSPQNHLAGRTTWIGNTAGMLSHLHFFIFFITPHSSDISSINRHTNTRATNSDFVNRFKSHISLHIPTQIVQKWP